MHKLGIVESCDVWYNKGTARVLTGEGGEKNLSSPMKSRAVFIFLPANGAVFGIGKKTKEDQRIISDFFFRAVSKVCSEMGFVM